MTNPAGSASARNGRGRALVVGFGSIGARHAGILAEMGMEVSVVSRRPLDDVPYPRYSTIAEAAQSGHFAYAVVATETSGHGDALRQLAQTGVAQRVMVEKPLFSSPVFPPDLAAAFPVPVYVGYQLRFHPGLRRLRALLAGRRVLSAQFYVGQHLDGWRLNRTGRDSYSGQASQGGGVLRDLSHELDLALWLFGECRAVTALGGRLGDVTWDSDDAWSILGRFQGCAMASLQMNYLDRIGQRRIVVVAEDTTIAVDLVRGVIEQDGRTEQIVCDRNGPLRDMHLSVLEDAGLDVCDYSFGLQVMALIGAIETAAASNQWVAP